MNAQKRQANSVANPKVKAKKKCQEFRLKNSALELQRGLNFIEQINYFGNAQRFGNVSRVNQGFVVQLAAV